MGFIGRSAENWQTEVEKYGEVRVEQSIRFFDWQTVLKERLYQQSDFWDRFAYSCERYYLWSDPIWQKERGGDRDDPHDFFAPWPCIEELLLLRICLQRVISEYFPLHNLYNKDCRVFGEFAQVYFPYDVEMKSRLYAMDGHLSRYFNHQKMREDRLCFMINEHTRARYAISDEPIDMVICFDGGLSGNLYTFPEEHLERWVEIVSKETGLALSLENCRHCRRTLFEAFESIWPMFDLVVDFLNLEKTMPIDKNLSKYVV